MSSVNVKRGWFAAVVLTVALVGCGDDDGGAAGAAGDTAGGSGGAAGVAGFSGVGGAGGSGGTAGNDDDAGVSGTGGTAGDAGAGGTGGSGGTAGSGGGCSTNCNDNNNCTVDACVNGTCTNTLDDSLCGSGQSCHPTNGCVTGGACSGSGDCADTDGCTTNERCDNALAQCLWDPLDGDNDGFAPRSCGGDDCNDADNDVHPGVDDVCDGEDNDCDEAIDEDATCSNGGSCVDGACVCGDLTTCGTGITARCVDTTSSATDCGGCGMSCGPAGTCVDSACQCTSPGALCTNPGPGGGQLCVNTDTSAQHCGGCNMPCGTDAFCNGGTCADCGGDGEPCCPAGGNTAGGLSSDGCPGAALICTGERGSPSSVCGCPSPNEICTTVGPGGGQQCVNTDTSSQHCGGCGMACSLGQTCSGGQCSQCGQQAGQPCCVITLGASTFYTCPDMPDLVSCNQDTRLCE